MALKTTTDRDMIETRHYQKVCACGCGVAFGTNRPYAKFASPACRVRANRAKHRGTPQTLLGVDLSSVHTKKIAETVEQLEQIAAWEKAQKNYLVSDLVNGLIVAIAGKSKTTAVSKVVTSNLNARKLGIKPKQKQLM